MKKVMIYLLLAILFVGHISGCITNTDPATGKKTTKWFFDDPNTVKKVDEGAEAVVTLMTVLSAIFPVLTPVAGAAGGALVLWKKLKPKLVEAENQRDGYYAGGEVLAVVLEDIKINYPDIWKKIAPELEKGIKISTAIENAVRGFRGLPPKDLVVTS